MAGRPWSDHGQRLLRLAGAEAEALSETFRGLHAMLASERPSATDWPIRPTVALVVGAFRIARELEDCEEQLKRDAARLLTGGTLERLAGRAAAEPTRDPRDLRAVAAETGDAIVTWLLARLPPGPPSAG